jgi:hypothetical protein
VKLALSWLCTEAPLFWSVQHHYSLTDSCYHLDDEAWLCAVRRNTKVRKYCEQDSEGRACTKKRRGTFQADSYSVQAGQSSVQGLPADVLLQIFAFLNPKAQRETLPLVCRHWQEVLQGPVALWRHLELDFPAAMDLGLDRARLTPSRRFQVCPLYVFLFISHSLDAAHNKRQDFDARETYWSVWLSLYRLLQLWVGRFSLALRWTLSPDLIMSSQAAL